MQYGSVRVQMTERLLEFVTQAGPIHAELTAEQVQQLQRERALRTPAFFSAAAAAAAADAKKPPAPAPAPASASMSAGAATESKSPAQAQQRRRYSSDDSDFDDNGDLKAVVGKAAKEAKAKAAAEEKAKADELKAKRKAEIKLAKAAAEAAAASAPLFVPAVVTVRFPEYLLPVRGTTFLSCTPVDGFPHVLIAFDSGGVGASSAPLPVPDTVKGYIKGLNKVVASPLPFFLCSIMNLTSPAGHFAGQPEACGEPSRVSGSAADDGRRPGRDVAPAPHPAARFAQVGRSGAQRTPR